MSIRKCKRKLALCIAALFWTACGNDSSTGSDETSSNSPENPYILAIRPNVHCKDSTIFQKATCKNAAVPKNSSDIKFAAPLYGVPCIAEDRNTPIFKCEDGSMFPNNNTFSLVGDTIVQFTDFCEELIEERTRADECIAKKAEEAEANPATPYKLASDTTINCKQTFKPILSKLEPILIGVQSEYLIPEGCFKCDDGNIYEWDDYGRKKTKLPHHRLRDC